jgi:hypothetical protein
MKQEADRSQPIEEQLRAQNLFFKDALDALAYPFCVVNTENYIVELANAAAYNGHMHEDVTCYKLLHGSSKKSRKQKNRSSWSTCM